jgi:hypothetical protein
VAAVGEHPGVLAGQLGKGGHDCEPELVGETEVRLVKRPDHLAAQLDDAAVGERRLLDTAAGPVAGLDHDDIRAALHQIACGAESREPRAHYHHVRFHGMILS